MYSLVSQALCLDAVWFERCYDDNILQILHCMHHRLQNRQNILLFIAGSMASDGLNIYLAGGG